MRADAPLPKANAVQRVSDFVDHFARHTPDAEAMVLGDQRINYREFQRRVESCARALLAAGVRKGDRVATLSTPHPDYFVTFLAAASIGAIWLGLNPRYRTAELEYVVGDAEPGLLFARGQIDGRDYTAEIAAMQAVAPQLKSLVILDDASGMRDGESLDAFLRRGAQIPESVLSEARAACGGRDPCLLVYTSGSTGRPKGALLHHEGIVRFSLAQNRAWPLAPQRFLNYFPVNHVGCVIDVSCPTLAAGGCIVFLEQFEPGASLECMQREAVTAWASVPSVFSLQLALPSFADFDLTAVQLVIWEGAAMPEEIIRRLAGQFPRMASNYGMTETTSAITIVEPTDDIEVLANSVGYPFEGVEIRLADTEGRTVQQGQTGEVQCRSPYNMLGYWRRPEETAASFTDDGFFRTGDLAVQRPDGRYRIVGRLKEMFKSGGYNVYPREVESAIETHPAVEMAAVVSRPDPLWQEVGVAFVVLNATATIEQLDDHCRGRLAAYKVPKDFVLCPDLPLLPIGKVDKVALERRARGIGTTCTGTRP